MCAYYSKLLRLEIFSRKIQDARRKFTYLIHTITKCTLNNLFDIHVYDDLRLSMQTNNYRYVVLLQHQVHNEIKMSISVLLTLYTNKYFIIKSNSPKPNFTGRFLTSLNTSYPKFIKLEGGIHSENVGQRSTSHKMTLKGQVSLKGIA